MLLKQNFNINERNVMANIFYEKDASRMAILHKRVAIIGYGSQGHAHALNLHDNGVEVSVSCYPGSPSGERARQARLPVISIEEAALTRDVLMMLIPDEKQKNS